MVRRLAGLAALACLVAASLATGANAAEPSPPAVADHIKAYSVDPPGEDGTVTADEVASGSYGPNFDDQAKLYAKLIDDPDHVTGDELDDYWHPMQFGPGDDIVATETPIDGVRVYRDGLGVPHIYADNIDHAEYALGYLTAEDRLWEMDVFRHAAEGTLSEFIGPSYLPMDIATRREGYTSAEVQEMYDRFDDKFGAVGKEVQDGLQSFTDGVNAYIQKLKADPSFAARQPAEYDLTQNPFPVFPTEWTNVDTLQVAILELRVFGLTAGGELDNAALLHHLRHRLGRRKGTRAYDDLFFQNNPYAPTSIPVSDANFHTQDLGRLNRRSVALPDHPNKVAREADEGLALRDDFLAGFGFQSPKSNAFIVAPKKSATGDPLQVGAPQVGYAVPGFFWEIDLHVPAANGKPPIDIRGPAVPGASSLVPLGRGSDYAWTLTTGFSDAVDTRAELLCNPDGGEPTTAADHYVYKGSCRPMTSRTERFVVKPSVADPGAPDLVDKTFYRTVHGPVIARGTVGGRPVAFVHQFMFWKKEVDSIPAFFRWNTAAHTVAGFADAAKQFTMSFNAFYVNSRHIAYFHVGLYPRRTRHTSPSLPVWGTGEWEWHGRRPFAKQPQIVDPRQGWIVNWNNKPSKGWSNYDSVKWGTTQRVRLIQDDMHRLLDRGKATLADLGDVVRDIATRDVRAVYDGPAMIRRAGRRDHEARHLRAIALVRRWIAAGARRVNRDGADEEDSGNALALFDAWYTRLVHRVFDDEVGRGGYRLFAKVGAPISDYNPAGGSSFFFGFSDYLNDMFHRKTRRLYSHNYCDDIGTRRHEGCARQATIALRRAIASLTSKQGRDMSKWSTPAENIEFQALGAGSVDPIPWQNRGTHNHLVEVTGRGS